MRTDNWVGLNKWATEFTKNAKTEVIEKYEGAFGNLFERFSYCVDGKTYIEVVQCDIWDSGPSFFTKLLDPELLTDVPGSVWSDQELADYMGFQVGVAAPQLTPEDEEFFELFKNSIESGGIKLSWSLEEKYNRWKNAK